MKKKYLVFGIWVASSLYTYGQQKTDTGYHKRKLSQTEIQIVYSHYMQKGNHSAVTGGIGTEKMTVYSPDITIRKTVDSFNSYTINTGFDLVSSASVDNIDFIVSSASKNDAHLYLNAHYRKKLRHRPITVGGGIMLAMESDYLSAGFELSAAKLSNDQSREFSADLEVYFDDLRWGHLTGESPRKLVYPVELRYRDWLSQKKRQSYNLTFGINQIINRRVLFAVFPGISFQHGLLSTPFQRAYLRDTGVHVEVLPETRLKIPIGIQLNAFVGGRTTIRNYYRFYWDDWGILANSLQVEIPFKISHAFSIGPLLRLYAQSATRYFQPYAKHELSATLYTSDYDLSKFNSYEVGIESRLTPLGNRSSTPINRFGFRYSYYKRSDGLSAHLITLILNFSHKRNREQDSGDQIEYRD